MMGMRMTGRGERRGMSYLDFEVSLDLDCDAFVACVGFAAQRGCTLWWSLSLKLKKSKAFD